MGEKATEKEKNKDLREIVISLIEQKNEGDYWDFKKMYHSNKANLLHDIICIANNLTDNDGYIIFGVRDDTFDIVGVDDTDENRKNQNEFINFLKGKNFVAGIRPKVKLRRFRIENKKVDVLVIENTKNIPFYLEKDFSDGKRVVRANHIYTRIGDTNTDINSSADYDVIKQLWAKNLGVEQRHSELEVKIVCEKNKELVFQYEPPNGLIYSNSIDEKEVGQGVTVEEIREYNSALPSREKIREYNEQQSLYENTKKNCYEFSIEIENIGKCTAKNISAIFKFPPELLVYYDYEIEDIEEPEALELPKNPFVKKIMNPSNRLFKSGSRTIADILYPLEGYKILAQPTLSLINSATRTYNRNYYVGEDNSEIGMDIDDLLHKRYMASNNFSVIITKKGRFKIEYDIIYDEVSESLEGEFEIVVE